MRARVIARLDLKGENVVRGVHLEGLRVVGRPAEMAQRYCAEGIDELIFIDTVASLYGRNNALGVVERAAEHAFLPMTVGGGIRRSADVAAALRAGADKVAVNSAAVRSPDFLTEMARRFGSQCVVAAIEAKRTAPGRWTVLIDNGREPTGLDAVDWARRVSGLGAGELLLTSIDADGTRRGCDLELVRAVTAAVPIPVIASGGPGTVEDAVAAICDGHADAIALGTLLHFGLAAIGDVKRALAAAGARVRGARAA